MGHEQPDGGLRDLLADAIEETNAVLASQRDVAIPEGDAGVLWRWAFLYLVLASDLAGTVYAIAEPGHDRAILILRRIMFEYMVRLRYYRQRIDIARNHLYDFERRAVLFQKRLAPQPIALILDPTFDQSSHKLINTNFDDILEALFSGRGSDLYANFYSYPSALIHGDAMAFCDVLEFTTEGTWTIHMKSRKDKTDETIYNYTAFFINLLFDATTIIGVGNDVVRRLHSRLDGIRAALGIEIDL
jgi:hypothetical protein